LGRTVGPAEIRPEQIDDEGYADGRGNHCNDPPKYLSLDPDWFKNPGYLEQFIEDERE
jgi:hypothetical protein